MHKNHYYHGSGRGLYAMLRRPATSESVTGEISRQIITTETDQCP